MKSMKMVKKVQAGFTLIELMIVVAIIGILAAVAIPAYQNYIIKAKLGTAMTSVDSVKAAIATCAQEGGITPGQAIVKCDNATNPEVPLYATTKNASATSDAAGVITLTLANIGPQIDTKTITMAPSVTTSAIKWTVSTTVVQADQPAAYAVITKNNGT